MKSRIPDNEIKKAVARYKKGDEKSYKSIVDMLSEYIYNYPCIVFGATPDISGDFYEYVLQRLKNILQGYRESDALFSTWFTVVLRNRYLNFVRAESTRNRDEKALEFVSLDWRNNNDQNLYNIIADSKVRFDLDDYDYEHLIDSVVKNLKDKYRIYFHLYFIETLRPDDVGFLSIYLDRNIRELIRGLEMVRTSMAEKYRMKNRLYRRLNALYYEILRNQKEKNQSIVEKVKKKRNKVLDEYKRVKMNPSYESIAKFLGLPIGTVSSGILRMKKDVKYYFEEHYREKMSVS